MKHWRSLLASLLLFVSGFAVCRHFANMGFNPLDQSTVFDGGWRILSGQIPYRDFTMLTGVLPSAIQALFFRFFGVNWPAYTLHSSLANGLFCVLAFFFLRFRGLAHLPAFAYAFGSTVSFYSLMGTPYMEQEGFLFLLLVWLCLDLYARAASSAARYAWALLAALLYLACFFCKQNVAVFSLIATLAFLPLILRSWRELRPLLLMSTLALLLLALLGWGLGISWALFWESNYTIPAYLGGQRGGPLNWLYAGWLHRSASIITVGFSQLCLLAFWIHRGFRLLPFDRLSRILVFAAALEFSSMFFVGSTYNWEINGFPWIFIALGLLHSCLRELPSWRSFAAPLLLLLAVREAVPFAQATYHRYVGGMTFSALEAQTFQTLELQPLRYQVSSDRPSLPAPIVDQLLSRLRSASGNFLLFGETNILYGLSGRPSVLPFGWLHDGIGKPSFQTRFGSLYDQRLLDSLRRHQVTMIVIETPTTSLGVKPDAFPSLDRLLRERTKSIEQLGPVRIHHLVAAP